MLFAFGQSILAYGTMLNWIWGSVITHTMVIGEREAKSAVLKMVHEILHCFDLLVDCADKRTLHFLHFVFLALFLLPQRNFQSLNTI